MYPPASTSSGRARGRAIRQIVAEELDVAVTSITIPQLGHRLGASVPGPRLDARRATEPRSAARRFARRRRRRGGRCSVSPRRSSACRSRQPDRDRRRRLGRRQDRDLRRRCSAASSSARRSSTGANLAPLKPTSQYKVVGTRVPRFDIPDKVTGKHIYMQNVRVPGMLHGRPVRPRGQANVLAVDRRGRPGELHAAQRRRELDQAHRRARGSCARRTSSASSPRPSTRRSRRPRS